MKIPKNFLIAAVIFTMVLLALIIFRSSSYIQFRYNASKWAKSSIEHDNTITLNDVEKMHESAMLICLDHCPESTIKTVLNTSSEEIMNKETIRRIRKHDGPKVLVSGDMENAARLWMVLSQTGVRDLFILNEE